MRAVVYLRNSSGKQATAGTDEGQLQQAHVTAARLDALAEALGDGALSAESYRAQVARIVARRDLLAQQVTTWEAAREPSGVSAGAVAALRMEIRALLADASPESRRALLRRCCPSLVYDGTDLQVVRVGGGVCPLMRMPMRIAI